MAAFAASHDESVPADLLVYTADEWESVVRRPDRFGEEMRNVTWLVPSGQRSA